VRFIIEESDEIITAHSGLALIGALLEKTNLTKRLNQSHVPGNPSPDISHRDVAVSYLGLLCHGKSDFDHIEPFREDEFFAYALQIDQTPSSPTLRQRLDQAAEAEDAGWEKILLEESAALLKKWNVSVTPITLTIQGEKRAFTPLDIDVSPFDNSFTKKEGVSRTYKGHDGYSPIFAYLGLEGYAVNTQLRNGSDHVQKGTAEFLANSILYAKEITKHPILVRMDAGNDSIDNLQVCFSERTRAEFIIKRNLRKEKPESWLAIARQHGICCEERPGKYVYRGSQIVSVKGIKEKIRLIFEVIERTISADGQLYLIPEIEVQTFWTSLPIAPSQIIELYHAHGTMEQFHSEIKTDLDVERLPSGKFDTNNLVLHFAIVAYNLLRLLGQESLKKNDTPIKKKAQRRRIRTVIQSLITMAAKMTHHARQIRLRFGRNNPWIPVFRRIYTVLLT
jgi:Transposase DDE domain group 1